MSSTKIKHKAWLPYAVVCHAAALNASVHVVNGRDEKADRLIKSIETVNKQIARMARNGD